MILILAKTNIKKKTRITITNQIEKTQHHFMMVNPVELTSSEIDRVKKEMGVEMVFVNGRLYNNK